MRFAQLGLCSVTLNLAMQLAKSQEIVKSKDLVPFLFSVSRFKATIAVFASLALLYVRRAH